MLLIQDGAYLQVIKSKIPLTFFIGSRFPRVQSLDTFKKRNNLSFNFATLFSAAGLGASPYSNFLKREFFVKQNGKRHIIHILNAAIS